MQQPPFTALAAVYDAIMADVEYDYWADFVLTYACDGGLEWRGMSALDLACGTGGFTRELVKAGLRVTGLDASEDMLREARRLLPGTDFVAGDLRSFALPERFELITCVFDSVNNLLSPAEVRSALTQCYLHLKPGGLLAFDANTRLGVRELWEGDAIEGVAPLSGGGEVHYHWSHHHDAQADLGVVQAFCRLEDGSEFIETHRERGYDPADLEPLLREAGFERFEIVEYPDYAPPAPDVPRVWVFAWRIE